MLTVGDIVVVLSNRELNQTTTVGIMTEIHNTTPNIYYNITWSGSSFADGFYHIKHLETLMKRPCEHTA